MIDEKKSAAFRAKAARLVRWAKKSYDEMQQYGREARLDDVERLFFTILALIASAHEALGSAARLAGLESWRDGLNGARATDQLLLYIWKARDSDIHDALIKWEPGGMLHLNVKVVDVQKAQAAGLGTERWFYFLYGGSTWKDCVTRARESPPSSAALEAAGVELVDLLKSLSLREFKVRSRGATLNIAPPCVHRGKALPPSAQEATRFAITFYEEKLGELNTLCSSER